jgi:hypothetical protein
VVTLPQWCSLFPGGIAPFRLQCRAKPSASSKKEAVHKIMQIFILNSDPDTPPLTVRPSKKRKALDDEAAFPEAAALSSVVAAVAAA